MTTTSPPSSILETPFTTLDLQLFTSIRRTERSYDCIDDVNALLHAGANPNVFDIMDGNSALMYAAYSDRPDVVATLLLHNADIFHTNFVGQNVFIWACISGSIPSLRILFDYIQFTPNLKTSTFPNSFNHHQSNNIDHLPTITSLNQPTPLKLYNNSILEDIFAMRCQTGLTMLHYAVRFRRKATVIFLYYKGSHLTYIDKNGRNVLHHACQLDIPNIATWLTHYGLLDVTQQDFEGNTPIHHLMLNRHYKTLETFIKYHHASRAFGINNCQRQTPYSLISSSRQPKLIHLADEKLSHGFNFWACYGFAAENGGALWNRLFLWCCCHFGLTYNLIVRYIRTNIGMARIDHGNNHKNDTKKTIKNKHNKPQINSNDISDGADDTKAILPSHTHNNNKKNASNSTGQETNPLILSSLTQSDSNIIDIDNLDTTITSTINSNQPHSNPNYSSLSHTNDNNNDNNGNNNNEIVRKSMINIRPQYYSSTDMQEDYHPDQYIPNNQNMQRLYSIGSQTINTMSMDSFQNSPSSLINADVSNSKTLSKMTLLQPINPTIDLSPIERATLWMATSTGNPLPPKPSLEQWYDNNSKSAKASSPLNSHNNDNHQPTQQHSNDLDTKIDSVVDFDPFDNTTHQKDTNDNHNTTQLKNVTTKKDSSGITTIFADNDVDDDMDTNNDTSEIWSRLIMKYNHFKLHSMNPSLSLPTSIETILTSIDPKDLKDDPPTDKSAQFNHLPIITTTLETITTASPDILLPPLLDYLEADTIFDPPYIYDNSYFTTKDNNNSNNNNRDDDHTDDDKEETINIKQSQPLYFLRNGLYQLSSGLDIFNNHYKSFCNDWNDRNIPSFWAGRYLFTFIFCAVVHLCIVIFPYQWASLTKEFTKSIDGNTVTDIPLGESIYLGIKQAILCLLSLSILITWLICHYSDPGVIQPAPAREIRQTDSNNVHFNHNSHTPSSQPQHDLQTSSHSSHPTTPTYTTYFNNHILSPIPLNNELVYLYPTRAQHVQEIAHLQYTHSLMHFTMSSGLGAQFVPKTQHKIVPIPRKPLDSLISSRNGSANRCNDRESNLNALHSVNYDDISHLDDIDIESHQQYTSGPSSSLSRHRRNKASKTNLDNQHKSPKGFFISPYGDRNILHPIPHHSNHPQTRIHPEQMYFPLTAQGIVQTAPLFNTETTSTSQPNINTTFSDGLSISSQYPAHSILSQAFPHLLISNMMTDYNNYAQSSTFTNFDQTNDSTSPSSLSQPQLFSSSLQLPYINSITLYNTYISPNTYLPQSIYSTTPINYQQPHFLAPPLTSVLSSPSSSPSSSLTSSMPMTTFNSDYLPTQPHHALLSPTCQYPLDGYLLDPFSDVNTSTLYTRHWNFFSSYPIHSYFQRTFPLSSYKHPLWFSIPLSYEPSTLTTTNFAASQYIATTASQMNPMFSSSSNDKSTLFTNPHSNAHQPSLTSTPFERGIDPNDISLFTAINIAFGAIWDSIFHSKIAMYILPSWTQPIIGGDCIETSYNHNVDSINSHTHNNRDDDRNLNESIQKYKTKQNQLLQKHIAHEFNSMVLNEVIPTLSPELFFTNPINESISPNTSFSSLPQSLETYLDSTPSTTILPLTNSLLTSPEMSHLPTPNDSPFFCASHFLNLLNAGIVTTPHNDGNNQFPLDQNIYAPSSPSHTHNYNNNNNNNSTDIINQNKSAMLCLDCRIATPLFSYHCKTCGHCCYWLDHHCPLLDACIGAGNYRSFVLFCFLGTTMSLYYLFTLIMWFISISLDAMGSNQYSGKNPFLFLNFVFYDLGHILAIVLLFHIVIFSFFVSLLFLSHIVMICCNESSVTSMDKAVVKYQPKVYISKRRCEELSAHSITHGTWYNSATTIIDCWKLFLIGRMNAPLEFPTFGQALSPMKLKQRFSPVNNNSNNNNNNPNDGQIAIPVHPTTNVSGPFIGNGGINPNRMYYKQDLLYLDSIAIPLNVQRLRKFVIKTLFGNQQ